MQLSDEQHLINELKAPETRRAAFNRLVKEYSPLMYAQIRRMVNGHEDADDILQNALVKVWGGLDKFRGDARLATWLYRIAYNETVTYMSTGHAVLSIDAPLNNARDPEEEKLTVASRLMADPYFDGDETEAQLQEAIATLPPKQRAVFNMKYYDDMKYEDMSLVLETSVGALKASFHHAVKKITAFFQALE